MLGRVLSTKQGGMRTVCEPELLTPVESGLDKLSQKLIKYRE
jgi:hypothetical protein